MVAALTYHLSPITYNLFWQSKFSFPISIEWRICGVEFAIVRGEKLRGSGCTKLRAIAFAANVVVENQFAASRWMIGYRNQNHIVYRRHLLVSQVHVVHWREKSIVENGLIAQPKLTTERFARIFHVANIVAMPNHANSIYFRKPNHYSHSRR